MHFLTETKRIPALLFDKKVHVGSKQASAALTCQERETDLRSLREAVELVNAFFFYLMFDMSTKEVVDVIPDASEIAVRKDPSSLSEKDSNPKRVLKIIYYKRKKSNASWLHITDEETKELFSQVAESLLALNQPSTRDNQIESCFLPRQKAEPLSAEMRD